MEAKPINDQFRKLRVESAEDLMLTTQEREQLNARLDNIGPNILNTKKISKEESEKFLEQDFDLGGPEVDLSDFQ